MSGTDAAHHRDTKMFTELLSQYAPLMEDFLFANDGGEKLREWLWDNKVGVQRALERACQR